MCCELGGFSAQGPGQAGPGWMSHLRQGLSFWGVGVVGGNAVTEALQSPSVNTGDPSPFQGTNIVWHIPPRAARGHHSSEGNGYLEGFGASFPLGNGLEAVPPCWHAQLDTESLNPKPVILQSKVPHTGSPLCLRHCRVPGAPT